MTQPNVYKFRVSFEVAVNEEDAKTLVDEYGDLDEFDDDPSGATELAVENYLEGETFDHMDVASAVKVNFVEN